MWLLNWELQFSLLDMDLFQKHTFKQSCMKDLETQMWIITLWNPGNVLNQTIKGRLELWAQIQI